MTVPDYSAEMLQAFLFVQVRFENRISYKPGADSIRIERDRIRAAAGVTRGEFWEAWRGKPVSAEVRTRIWAALGVFPGLQGWLLTDDGGQVRAGASQLLSPLEGEMPGRAEGGVL